MRAKTIISYFIIISLLSALLLTSCSEKKVDYTMVDEHEYEDLVASMQESFAYFESNEEMRDAIVSWAKSNGIVYTTDDGDNIIITLNASSGNEKRNVTVICTEYEHTRAAKDINSLAAAMYIAKNQPSNGPAAIVFLNNENNSGIGIRSLNRSYFNRQTKVIFLSSGSSTHLSTSSHALEQSIVTIPAERVERTCDTGIRVHLSGLETSAISSDIASYPNPIIQLSNILTRLENKSMINELAEVELGSDGFMYPTSMDALILINSYSLDSVTKYLDKRISDYMDKNQSKHPNVSFTYEIIDDSELPDTVFDGEAKSVLNNYIYTFKNGAYSFSENMEIPEGYNVDDTYAVNCINGIEVTDDAIKLRIFTSAIDEEHVERVISENRTAADFTGATLKFSSGTRAYEGSEDLAQSLSELYRITNNNKNGIEISPTPGFTSCSYLHDLNAKMDTVLLHFTDKTRVRIVNMLMNYLAGTELPESI